jgi:dipeptidase
MWLSENELLKRGDDMHTRAWHLFLILGLIMAFTVRWELTGCTIVAAGKKATIDDSVMVSHTDCGPDSRIYVVAGRKYKPGSRVPVYWGIQDPRLPLKNDGEIIGYIPQVRQTHTYFHSAYPHCNRYQLAIAESTMSQRSELVVIRDKDKKPKQIMTVEQAQVFALQRCKKAREAVKLIGELMTTYGFLCSSGDGSEALAIADTDEVWIMEIFGVGQNWTPGSGKPGAIWAAQRLGDDQATMIPNWSIIKEINIEDPAHFMASINYMQEAIDNGWFDPNSNKPFIWQDVYSPIPREWATGRFWLFHHTFSPGLRDWPNRTVKSGSHKGLNQYYQYVEPLSVYPFSFKPEKKLSLQDIMAFQRSTFEGTIYDLTSGPQWLVPDEKGGFIKSPLATPFPGNDLKMLLKLTNRRPVARHRGHYGMICQLRGWLPDEIGGIYWVYLDNPHISPYVPIYMGNSSVADAYNTYHPDKFQETSARWAIDFVDNLAKLKFQEAIKDIRAARDPFEKEIFQTQKTVETEAMKRYKRSSGSARNYLTDHSNSLINGVMKIFRKLRYKLIVKYTNNRE